MKFSVWDILAIAALAGAVIFGALVLVIFINPNSSVNPFPPPTLPPTLLLPTSTATLVQLPPTWTPTPQPQFTQRPTGTPIPTETPFVFPTRKAIPARTPTP